MNGDGFRELRALAAFDRKTAAAVLGVTERTIRNWEASRARVPYSALELLRVLGCYGLPGSAWAGWSIRGDALYSPERLAFRAHDAAWWSLTCSMARQWQQERGQPAHRDAQLHGELVPLTLLDTCEGLTALVGGLDVKSGHGSATGCGLDIASCRGDSLPAKPGLRGHDHAPALRPANKPFGLVLNKTTDREQTALCLLEEFSGPFGTDSLTSAKGGIL
ncbi:MAG: VC1465 family Xer recombination activation factor [Burkholderiales bacterium]|nr:VC1465 family Xer recombination activation factor [Burkholderiales bacterium]